MICNMHFASIETLSHRKMSIGNAVIVMNAPMSSGRNCNNTREPTMYMITQSQKILQKHQTHV